MIGIDGGDDGRPPLAMAASRFRVLFATGVLAVLGFFIVEIAVSGHYGFGARLMMLAFASGLFVLAWRVWQSGQVRLELADGALREAGKDGRVLVALPDIVSVDRGVFAFKPSNGFLVRTRDGAPAAWVPGIWWRRGRSIGIGGLIPAHQTKLVAEVLSVELARRGTAPPDQE